MGELPDPLPATLIAFYLPQFHSIPENDEWWGKGFTEWRNVTRALPQFEGHAQPRLPGDLGFYDLRDPEVMREQARLAREYGIGAFCFYFYWFGGKTLLETPLRNWLADRTSNLSFCLCWANEKWSRRWDGRGDAILIDQQHSAEDDLAFIEHVAEYMRDPRYLRVDGKPLLLLYRPELLPDPGETALRWRNWCVTNGLGQIHLAYVQGFERPDPRGINFDAAVEFPPNLSNPTNVTANLTLINAEFTGDAVDWRELPKQSLARTRPTYVKYPSVNPGWDNEPRRPGKGRVYLYASPQAYGDWLLQEIRSYSSQTALSERLVFVNAWNEWAEGAVLEPDTRLGYANLDATRRAMLAAANSNSPASDSPCAVIHAWYLDVLDELLIALRNSGISWRIVITTVAENVDTVRQRLFAHHMSAEIVVTENRGRDVLPFLRVAHFLQRQGVRLILKLHTKRSTHRTNGEQWRRELVDRLLRPSRANRILEAFEDPNLGLVAPEGHVLPIKDYLGANQDALSSLVSRVGLRELRPDDEFVPGSMFWVSTDAIRPLLDAQFLESEFETETGQIDGTLAHAVERAFGLSTAAAGLTVATAASTCNEPEPTTTAYEYARKS